MKHLRAALLALTILPLPLQAQEAPLLIEGKSQLYQRILVRDRVDAMDAAEGGKKLADVAAMQPLYVYERNGDSLRVGPDKQGTSTFWIPEAKAIDWNQNIVVTFEGSESVGRVLFFNELDDLYDLVEAEDSAPGAVALRDAAQAAERDGEPAEKIAALGPRDGVDQRTNLYVMPILEAEEAIMESGADVSLLKVAVARARNNSGAANAPQKEAKPEDFKAGIVFVVDTTISMGNYIRATRSALEDIYKYVEQSNAGGVVSFGLVGYRDNMSAAPGLDYEVQTFVDLNEGAVAGAFLDGIDRMTEATTPSKNFREDSYAGIEHAVNTMDWSEYGSKLIVLVTDAGPREATDALSATKLSAQGLNSVVKEGIGASIAVLHLRTERGAKDHASAEAAYRALAQVPNQPSLYYGVDEGDLSEYQAVAGDLAQLIADEVIRFRSGGANKDFSEKLRNESDFARALSQANRTMQLKYLGREQGTQAPDVFEAWVADRDFERNGLKPLSIRLLLSKAQLSDLDEALKIIIEQQEESILDPTEFFSQVLGAAADMSRAPDDVSRRSSLSLAEAVSISEYLEGLPYKSRIMSVTEEDWIKMSTSEQLVMMNEFYEKIERYRRYNEATDQWVNYLGSGSDAQNLLYPMLLNDLP